MRKFTLLILLLFFLRCPLHAQQNPEWNSGRIKLQLEKLNTLGRVLYIAAHPDDENTRLLAFLSYEKKYRTAYMSLTRGDGGQNLVGDEQGSYLGLMRTEEQLAARHIDGAKEFFSRANDFGYSKTAKETFRFWGHQRTLADVVWVVRKFRPDIIICRFPADKRAGHGHHWASAILAHEAFKEAANPNKFPEQLKYVKTWQAKRILWNTYHFGHLNTTSPRQFKIEVDGFNPLIGKSYGELGAESRSMNKTQGFGVSPSYGKHMEYFKTIYGPKPQKTLMDGVNTTWSRVKGGTKVESLIQQALRAYDADHPEKIVPQLLKIRSAIQQIPNTYWRRQKTKEVDKLILACSSIWLDAYSTQHYIVAGQPLKVHVDAINRSPVNVSLQSVNIITQHEALNKKLGDNGLEKKDFEVTVPDTTSISQPYWLLKPHPVGYYHIPKQKLVGRPKNPPTLTATFNLNIDGQKLAVSRQIMYQYTDPVHGQVRDPLDVTPPVTANIEHHVYVYTSQKSQEVEITLASYKNDVKGTLHLETSPDFTVQNNDRPFSLSKAGDKTVLRFNISPSHAIQSSVTDSITVHLKVNGKDYDRGIKDIKHNYIPEITVFPVATAKLVSVPLKVSGHHVGYIMGAGDKVPQALRQIGYNVTMLSNNDLSYAPLKQYDAIVTGIRAFNTRDRLKSVHNRLMQYVKNGGTLVVQYNKNFGLVTKNIGPYPFKVTSKRVTDETAHVTFTLPNDPVLNTPNKITEKDFNGWIQERGVYFLQDVDSHYREPLSMHDPNDPPLKGSLIVCDYGKGKFVYTGLDFFRQ
ncbi:MAG TPA: PIG-L family deacetylase, partial [Balneolaceae bacterium]|nr:PIG-L family deacetylase [Balneolaceae bacterium]